MDDKELIECGPIEAMRLLTGMFEPESAMNRCYLVNLICRYVQGFAEETFVLEVMKRHGIKLLSIEGEE